MKLQYIFYIPFLICLMLFSSCLKEDITPPTATFTGIEEGDTIQSGGKILLEHELKDNRNLALLTLQVQSREVNKILHPIAPFNYFIELATESKWTSGGNSIEIPQDVASGHYTFIGFVSDVAGNKSEDHKINFFIQNSRDTILPELDLQIFPNPVNVGGKITIRGKLTDNKDLGALFITFFDIQGNKLFKEDIHATGTETIIDHEITAPAVEGQYIIKLLLADKVNNQFSDFIKIIVVP